jgi:hypothetical protein
VLDRGWWVDSERLLQPLAVLHADCAQVVLGLARLQVARGEFAEAECFFFCATFLGIEDAVVYALFV